MIVEKKIADIIHEKEVDGIRIGDFIKGFNGSDQLLEGIVENFDEKCKWGLKFQIKIKDKQYSCWCGQAVLLKREHEKNS